ncbi:hypothetical protein PMIN03_008986 [Paraphaeosphaeria minitans]|uniref:Uncharacterized protein n=1 Tax=Paraphaeosphaeria minitans TaxID=565426 RepID=A0A9P6GSR2_9PLEO|nr:hypothetical protein PMIN01_02198 [Paraphaeosphaeria minitans]
MPSLLNKVFLATTASRRKHNPYSDPHHPNHSTTCQPAPPSTTAEQVFSTSRTQIHRTRDPRDYLAGARDALARDASPDPDPDPARSQNRVPTGIAENTEREGRSVHQEASEARPNAQGTKYDLFVREMQARKAGQWSAPVGGFYAPERQLGEFYQPVGAKGGD